jgi:hypothetical protein
LWLALWAVFLPTGVLAWSEPEALEPTAGAPAGGLSEAARDGLLASALATGLILGALLNRDHVALLPLVAALTLVGGLAHRKRYSSAVAFVEAANNASVRLLGWRWSPVWCRHSPRS